MAQKAKRLMVFCGTTFGIKAIENTSKFKGKLNFITMIGTGEQVSICKPACIYRTRNKRNSQGLLLTDAC